MQDVVLIAGQSIASDIALVPGARPTVDIWMTTLPDVTLAPARRETSRNEGWEPSSYFGILKRWTGSMWVKSKLLYYAGSSWIAAKLKRWTGTEWVQIDTTGR